MFNWNIVQISQLVEVEEFQRNPFKVTEIFHTANAAEMSTHNGLKL